MTVYDRMHDQKVKISLLPIPFNTAAVNAPPVLGDHYIDTAGYKAAVIYLIAGAPPDTGSSYVFRFMGSPDHSTWTAIDTTNGLVNTNVTVDGSQSMQAPGTVATVATQSQTVAYADGAGVRRFGYVGPQRYLRVDILSTNGTLTTGQILCGLIELLEPDVKPVFQDAV
jgi:hypothetical protein